MTWTSTAASGPTAWASWRIRLCRGHDAEETVPSYRVLQASSDMQIPPGSARDYRWVLAHSMKSASVTPLSAFQVNFVLPLTT